MNSLCRHNGIMSTFVLIFHDVDITLLKKRIACCPNTPP